jgi:ABC-2 type transport system ATP-binding protein
VDELGGPGVTQSLEALLSVRGITKRYGEREALRNVSFEARAGERVAVIGPNGAGKTTLLSIVAGVQSPSSGNVNLPPSRVGWVPQQTAVYSRLSVAENLELFARLERARGHRAGGQGEGGPADGKGDGRGEGGQFDPREAVAAMLEQTGLRERASERVERLSGGNRQRVNIAIGLLSEPPVLALDEPSSSLDPRQRERLWEFICEHSQRGRCVVFSTHNVSEAERYAHQVIVLADGELLFGGSPQELSRAVGSTSGPGSTDSVAPSTTLPDGGLDFEGAFVEFLRERGH